MCTKYNNSNGREKVFHAVKNVNHSDKNERNFLYIDNLRLILQKTLSSYYLLQMNKFDKVLSWGKTFDTEICMLSHLLRSLESKKSRFKSFV